MGIVKLLREASAEILDWGAYADEYFQDKHDLQGCAKVYRDAADELEKAEPYGHCFRDFNGSPYFVDECDPEYGEGFDVYTHPQLPAQPVGGE